MMQNNEPEVQDRLQVLKHKEETTYRCVDYMKLDEAMLKNANQPGDGKYSGRVGIVEYNELGYVPVDVHGESVARTLEFAYDDYCISEMAKALGKNQEHQQFKERALRYKNVLDGVIVSMANSEVQFCLNNYSPRYIDIKQSSLAKDFGPGLYDPMDYVEKGQVFIVDAPIDRSNRELVIKYWKEKHRIRKLTVMTMIHLSVQSLILDS